MVYPVRMPTNKLWLEHTERAAWDSVEALRERLLKAENRLQALLPEVDQVPELLTALEEAKQAYATDARSHEEVVRRLVVRIEQLQAQTQTAKAPEPTIVNFAAALPSRPRLDSEDLDEPPPREPGGDLDLVSFTQTMQRRFEREPNEAPRDLNRLLAQAEAKLDDLTELEGAALREATIDLAIVAARIYGASRAMK
jgi:hypothetical protein